MKSDHIRDYPGGRIHLIGIGGSSMSGLAEMLIDQGYHVTGSDRDERAPILSYIQPRFHRIIRSGLKPVAWGFLPLKELFCWGS